MYCQTLFKVNILGRTLIDLKSKTMQNAYKQKLFLRKHIKNKTCNSEYFDPARTYRINNIVYGTSAKNNHTRAVTKKKYPLYGNLRDMIINKSENLVYSVCKNKNPN